MGGETASSLLIEESSGLSIVKQGRISLTALKVAPGLITLSVKDDWAQRLPPGLVEVSERLLLASGSPGYGPRMMRVSRQPWMIRVYQIQDLLMPGQFEGFGHRKIFMQQQVEAAINQGARQVLVVGAGFCVRDPLTPCTAARPQTNRPDSGIPSRLKPGLQQLPVDSSAQLSGRFKVSAREPNTHSPASEIAVRHSPNILPVTISAGLRGPLGPP